MPTFQSDYKTPVKSLVGAKNSFTPAAKAATLSSPHTSPKVANNSANYFRNVLLLANSWESENFLELIWPLLCKLNRC